MSFILNGHVLAGASGPSVNRYTDNPAMDGTASPGASGQYADGAHVHPSDTTKADKSDLASIKATGSTNGTGSTIAAGTYFYLNDVLVCAKTSIASGATFTSGTNYEVVTAGALNELKSAFSKNTIGTSVDLTAYSASNKYVFPCDGYVVIQSPTTSIGNRSWLFLYDATGELIGNSIAGCIVAGQPTSNIAFVKRGMMGYGVVNKPEGISAFYPLQ